MGTETRPAGEDTFESLEEFHMILNELLQDKSMDKVRVEYEKLVHALKKSRENEKRLMSKCRELNAEVVSTSTKVAAALKLSQEDETTIASLKRELDKGWKMVDAAHDKERRDKESIRDLKEDVSKLMKMAEHQTGSSVDREQSNLLKMNEELSEERNGLLSTVESLREKLNKAIASQQELEAQRDRASENIFQLQQELQVQQNEISREMRLKEKLEKEVKQLHVDTEAKMGDIKALSLQAQRAKEEQQRLEQQLKELKIVNERCTRELEQTQGKNNRLLQECEQLSSVKEHLSLESQQNANALKMREEEVGQMRQEIAKQAKMREATQKKLHQVEDQKADVDVQRETLRAQIAGLEKERYAVRKGDLSQLLLIGRLGAGGESQHTQALQGQSGGIHAVAGLFAGHQQYELGYPLLKTTPLLRLQHLRPHKVQGCSDVDRLARSGLDGAQSGRQRLPGSVGVEIHLQSRVVAELGHAHLNLVWANGHDVDKPLDELAHRVDDGCTHRAVDQEDDVSLSNGQDWKDKNTH
ncbi:Cilia- and flagella-associated protein 58 [Liparis tanakae]|uniref:Cilia-and flagella-associated protein 58 n=1 Tax=Liparis tanakae TaxID=230148 RepID=A0A4Z2GEI3_9TELE|nr:Cilia- and flagella-associated protein 58 [Liparis tanakae]